MHYYQAEFTLFNKSLKQADNISSPNAYHQIIFADKAISVTDKQQTEIVNIPKKCSALIYPLLDFQLLSPQDNNINYLSINGAILGENLFSNSFFSRINKLLGRTDLSLLVIDETTTQSIRQNYDAISNEYKLECLFATLEILYEVARCPRSREVFNVSNHKKHRLFFNDVNEYIEKNIYKNIEIKEIACYFHHSESSFSHTFKALFGTPFHHYFLFKKIEKSCEMLYKTEDSIQEISYELGFSSPSHFISRFKQVKKMTPGKFRKSL